MNILILNGSPHVNGNTMAMVNAFVDGAREKHYTFTCQNIILENEFLINEFWNFPMRTRNLQKRD